MKARRNNKIGTISNWGEEFELTFWFKIWNKYGENRIDGTPNILHLTTGDDKSEVGNRVPAIYIQRQGSYSVPK